MGGRRLAWAVVTTGLFLSIAPLVALMAAPEVMPSLAGGTRAGDAERPADFEFMFRPWTTPEQRGQVAVDLWKLGVVESVTTDGWFREVRLREPGNLLAAERVRETLARHDAVTNVSSFVDLIRRSMETGPATP